MENSLQGAISNKIPKGDRNPVENSLQGAISNQGYEWGDGQRPLGEHRNPVENYQAIANQGYEWGDRNPVENLGMMRYQAIANKI